MTLLTEGNGIVSDITTNISEAITLIQTNKTSGVDLSAVKDKLKDLVHGIIDPIYGCTTGEYSTKLSLKTMSENYAKIFSELSNKYSDVTTALSSIGITGDMLALFATNDETTVDSVIEQFWNNVPSSAAETSKIDNVTVAANAVSTYFNTQNSKIQLEVQEITNISNELLTFIKTAWQALFDMIKNMIEKMNK